MNATAAARGQADRDPDRSTRQQNTGVHVRLHPNEWDALHDHAISEDRALQAQAHRFIREGLIRAGALEPRP